MNDTTLKNTEGGKFHLNKWYLDFIGKNGTAMIFYAAKLTWHGFTAYYTSWLHHEPASGVKLKYRFTNVQMPHKENSKITWNDTKFGITGEWESSVKMLQERIFESNDGYLDWKCYQPASNVTLNINGNLMVGVGYAEELILTALPWKIPMDELRWGHYGNEESNMVWIELKEKTRQQWLWLDGKKIKNCTIEDACISLPEKDITLNLNRAVRLESEKKLFNLTGKLVRYIPGFRKAIPVSFLMADEIKWLSTGQFIKNKKTLSNGMAIHELVNFNTG